MGVFELAHIFLCLLASKIPVSDSLYLHKTRKANTYTLVYCHYREMLLCPGHRKALHWFLWSRGLGKVWTSKPPPVGPVDGEAPHKWGAINCHYQFYVDLGEELRAGSFPELWSEKTIRSRRCPARTVELRTEKNLPMAPGSVRRAREPKKSSWVPHPRFLPPCVVRSLDQIPPLPPNLSSKIHLKNVKI